MRKSEQRRAVFEGNVRALELYMRTSPEAASFLDCFVADKSFRPVLTLNYMAPEPTTEQTVLASVCDRHLQSAFDRAGKELGERIDSGGRKSGKITGLEMEGGEVKRQLQATLQLNTRIDLGDARLKDILLAAAAESINRQRTADKDYTLACFEEDPVPVRQQMEKGFSGNTTAGELEALLPQMNILSEILPPLPGSKRSR